MKQPRLRAIPSVEKMLQALGPSDLPRPAVVAVVRRELQRLRKEQSIPDFLEVMARVQLALAAVRQNKLQPVINGTGILVHTNLGRSPLGRDVVERICEIGSNYNNLEFDLSGGSRGGRAAYLEHNLALLCGAEAATVVNNCAAALVLMLRYFTTTKPEVIVSRGELVQIGGGFRIPEILEAAGARLREVGTTNKTTITDYAKAISRETGLILKVHRSNFFMGGFVESPVTEDIAALARKRGVPFAEDLGSGAVFETETFAGLEHEPMPAQVLKSGVQLVCFSGDKLLGGPQAGIIAGKQRLVAALKREPFFRALRCDKLILAGLEATVDLYLRRSGEKQERNSTPNPEQPDTPAILSMLKISHDALRIRAARILSALANLPLAATLGEGRSQIGGGTLPRSTIASVTIDLVPKQISVTELAERVRSAIPPLIGYISTGKFRLDLRTIFSRQDEDVIRVVRSSLEA